MSKITFGKEIDMIVEGVPQNGATLIAYHSGGGGYPAGSLLQKNSAGEISYVGGGVGPTGPTGSAGSGGVTTFLYKTKAEMDLLVGTYSGLIPGTTYQISGVHPALYDDSITSGTTIYLTALTTSELSKEGRGEFYNPKYEILYYTPPDIEPVYDYFIWSNICSFFVDTLSATPSMTNDNVIISDNGATGTLFNYRLSYGENLFIPTSSGWTGSTSITLSDGVTASISSLTLKNYNIGDKVWWGGYCWVNLYGFVGDSVNSLVLNADWVKLPYDLVNYNKVIDIISYDYENDWISRRADNMGNDVRVDYFYGQFIMTTLSFYLYGTYTTNPISAFMFGSTYVKDNYVENSYFDCISIKSNIYNNILKGLSSISSIKCVSSTQTLTIINNNVLDSFSAILYNIMYYYDSGSCVIEGNKLYKSSISFNVFYELSGNVLNNFGQITQNSADIIRNNRIEFDSKIEFNKVFKPRLNSTFDPKYIGNNVVVYQSEINDNLSYIIDNNDLNVSKINGNILDGYGFVSNILKSSTIINNSNISVSSNNLFVSHFTNNNTLAATHYNISTCFFKNSTINLCNFGNNLIDIDFESTTINTIDFTLSTIIYQNHPKIIYKRPDGTNKFRYYDNTDTLVIANITD